MVVNAAAKKTNSAAIWLTVAIMIDSAGARK
jgi:hypothetical protein